MMSSTPYQCIDIADELPLLEKNAHVLDIRDPANFQTGRMKNAIHLSNQNLGDYIQETDFNTPIIVCCYHGNSSKNAADYLACAGFKEVYSLNGGFTQWVSLYPDNCDQG